jgi:hypothetical protein
MSASEYPQEATEEERDLGFRKIELFDVEMMGRPAVVIAKVLSASDVLVKIFDSSGDVKYSHRRWGYYKFLTKKTPVWKPIFSPMDWDSVPIFVQEFGFQTSHGLLGDDIVEVPFEYKIIEQ